MNIKIFKKVFIILSIFLTLISLTAGYYIYAELFGIATALLVASVFEILRLSCLFSIPYFSNILYKIFAIILYICVAGVCFFAAVISFNSRVIERTQHKTTMQYLQNQKDLYAIKNAYQKVINTELSKIKKDRAITEKKYTSWQSNVYKRRLILYDTKINDLISQRNKYFNELTAHKNDITWILNQKAILGISTITVKMKKDSISESIIELIGVQAITTQKIFGIALALIVELGIILLAIIGTGIKKSKTKSKKKYNTVKKKRNKSKEKKKAVSKKKKSSNIKKNVSTISKKTNNSISTSSTSNNVSSKNAISPIQNNISPSIPVSAPTITTPNKIKTERDYKKAVKNAIINSAHKGISTNLEIRPKQNKTKDIVKMVDGAEDL